MGCCESKDSKFHQVNQSQRSSKIREEMTCQICDMPFNTTNRIPMMLCMNQHNICKTCLDGFKLKVKLCPYCRMDIHLSKVTRNRMIYQQIEPEKNSSQTSSRNQETEEKKRRETTHTEKMMKLTQTREQTLAQAEKYHYQEVIYLLHVEEKKPFSETKEIKQERKDLTKIINFSIFFNIQKLQLNENQFYKLDSPGFLPHLTYLDLSFNKIVTLENLNSLPKLKQLNLWNNNITQIQNLQELTQLEMINLGCNQISKIEGLSAQKKLKELNLRSNKEIVKIQNLQNLSKLQHLDLSGNQIAKMQNLRELKALETVYLDNNQITEFQGVFKLPNLKNIAVWGNPIDRTKNYGALKAFEELFGKKISLQPSGKVNLLSKIIRF